MSPQRIDEFLNEECFCTSLDPQALEHALESELGRPGLFELLSERCPHLFSVRPIFVAAAHRRQMAQVVRAVEAVVALPAYREAVLAWAPPIARLEPRGSKSVFFGYDFHLSESRIGLIEINTNAGGAMLNAVLSRAQRACCKEIEAWLPSLAAVTGLEQRIVEMFRNEWRLAGQARPLRTVAIVDEAPSQQYLYPEFLLFQRLFERHGMQALIVDPRELTFREGLLWHESTAIDLVYNRLTDFSLDAPTSAPLREAYEQQAVVLTPHPRAHALYADKRNLVLLTDDAQLTSLGVGADLRQLLLEHIPRTELVTASRADQFWRERKGLFFKPAGGFGSRAAYRGDKLTQRVWSEIVAGGYVAQKFVAPGERALAETSSATCAPRLKFDVRNYVYDGEVQWTAARLYQGQTTNFRTPGGGFAAVFSATA